MKLVMTMLVRNEADIIRANIDFHHAMGVDHFLIMDHGSVDETLDILNDYSKEGIATVYHQTDPGYYQAEWVTEMARNAYVIHKADWVINNDADEFWWPCHGSLKDSLALVPAEVGGLYIKRYNFPPIRDRSSFSFYDDMVYRDLRSVNSHGSPLPGKMCHRACQDIIVSQGNHDAFGSAIYTKTTSTLMEILHFPIRSLTQLVSKITLGGVAYRNSPRLAKSVGSTWRALYETYQQVGLERYYYDQCLGSSQYLSHEGEEPRLQRDDRLQQFMSERQSRIL